MLLCVDVNKKHVFKECIFYCTHTHNTTPSVSSHNIKHIVRMQNSLAQSVYDSREWVTLAAVECSQLILVIVSQIAREDSGECEVAVINRLDDLLYCRPFTET